MKIKNLLKFTVSTTLIMILLSSCLKTKKYEEQEAEEIQNYLEAHPELDFELQESGLYYLDKVVGTGAQPVTSDTVFVYYTGTFLNGSVFDSNVDDDPYGFPVDESWVIPGFDEGVMLMKVGGTASLLIPSAIGYGNSGYSMPAYTPLLFTVTLDSIAPGPNHK